MLTAIGDMLNWAATGLLLPLLMLPLAAFIRNKRVAALFFLAAIAIVFGGASLFAILAADLRPPILSIGLIATCLAGVLGGAALIGANGAEALTRKIAPPIESIVRRVGRASLYLIIAMALAQFAAVILRYVFGLNFIAVQESITYLHGAVFLLAGGYALLTDDHVRVDIFYRDAPPRRKAMVDLAGTYLLMVPFCLVTLWAAGPYVANSWAVREGSMEQSGIKGVYLLKTLIPIYATLLLLAGFALATRAVETLRTRSA